MSWVFLNKQRISLHSQFWGWLEKRRGNILTAYPVKTPQGLRTSKLRTIPSGTGWNRTILAKGQLSGGEDRRTKTMPPCFKVAGGSVPLEPGLVCRYSMCNIFQNL